MINLAVFLTQEQMKIFHSHHKNIITRGGFGSGKPYLQLLDDLTKSTQKADTAIQAGS